MIAIFVYVGVEVTIQSNMGALLQLPEYGSVPNTLLFPFISLYWGSLMMGRWTGAAEAMTEDQKLKKILLIALPFLAFLVVYGVNFFKAQGVEGINISEIFLPYLGFVALMVADGLYDWRNADHRTIIHSFFHEWWLVVFGDVAVYFFAID